MFASIADWILSLNGALALFLVFLFPALESSVFLGFFFPGEIAVILGGVLAHSGRFPLWAAVLAAILGAFVGDTIGYWVGREYGRKMLHGSIGRMPFIKRHLAKNLDAAEAYVHKRRGSAVFFGRFTAALRVLVPGLAGMAEIPYPSFMMWNLLGGATWATTFVLLGFIAGNAWHRVEKTASWVGLGLLALILVFFIAARVLRRLQSHGRNLGDVLADVRPVAWLRATFPIQSAWLARRTETDRPTGFPLTFTVMVTGLLGWAFGGITEDVVSHNDTYLADPRVFAWMDAHRTAWATAIMKLVTWLGSWTVCLAVAIVVGLYFLKRSRDLRPGMWLLLAWGGALAFSNIVKAIVARPRPPVSEALVSTHSFSYPSGHATMAAAFWGMLAVILARGRVRQERGAAWAVAFLVVATVSFSRLYLGAHWFTDVLGGDALGGTWLFLLLSLALVDVSRAKLLFRAHPGLRSGAEAATLDLREGVEEQGG
jgi:undecaprenyl-diphosphatase